MLEQTVNPHVVWCRNSITREYIETAKPIADKRNVTGTRNFKNPRSSLEREEPIAARTKHAGKAYAPAMSPNAAMTAATIEKYGNKAATRKLIATPAILTSPQIIGPGLLAFSADLHSKSALQSAWKCFHIAASNKAKQGDNLLYHQSMRHPDSLRPWTVSRLPSYFCPAYDAQMPEKLLKSWLECALNRLWGKASCAQGWTWM